MNRGRLIVIGGGLIAIILIGLLGWYTLNRTSVNYGLTYTDSITNEKLTISTTDTTKTSDGDTPVIAKNQIAITGLDTFFGTVEESQRQHILSELTAFVRARIGAKPGRAGALNADVKKISDNPLRYQFTLVLVEPASKYPVTITLPGQGALVTATVDFGDATQ